MITVTITQRQIEACLEVGIPTEDVLLSIAMEVKGWRYKDIELWNATQPYALRPSLHRVHNHKYSDTVYPLRRPYLFDK